MIDSTALLSRTISCNTASIHCKDDVMVCNTTSRLSDASTVVFCNIITDGSAIHRKDANIIYTTAYISTFASVISTNSSTIHDKGSFAYTTDTDAYIIILDLHPLIHYRGSNCH